MATAGESSVVGNRVGFFSVIYIEREKMRGYEDMLIFEVD